MNIERSAGVLLHPTSLPGPFGIGDLGPDAYAFVDWLGAAGFGHWQVLPLGPTGYGNSPYQCHSAFAINPNLVSPRVLLRDGLVDASDLDVAPRHAALANEYASGRVDFAEVIPWKRALLGRARHHFNRGAADARRAEFDQFRSDNADWVEEYALFMALKHLHKGAPVSLWPSSAQSPRAAAAAGMGEEVGESIQQEVFNQWVVFRQWHELRSHAHASGVQLIGDVPIFAALDSADVWAHPELFCLDQAGAPEIVAGVPPDYFAPTGQLWGNPLFDWTEQAASGFAWWIRRIQSLLNLVDTLRLDHFRGLAGYWAVPSGAPTAESGAWLPGPGSYLLDALVKAIGGGPANSKLPIIAEDLGVVTPDVSALLTAYGLPGMRLLQFGFTGYQEDFLPHNYPVNCVAYTGTHDNDTTRGWFSSASVPERRLALDYLQASPSNVVAEMVSALWRSQAALVILPVQDILELGSEARMNYPGKPNGYWEWRMPIGALSNPLARQYRTLNERSGRLPHH